MIIGVNGGVSSFSTIQFCAKLYESLAIGLSLDEAVSRARLHLFELGGPHRLCDWGLFMVHMTCTGGVLFSRRASEELGGRQRSVRAEHAQSIGTSLELVRKMDGLNFGEIMSELTRRRCSSSGASAHDDAAPRGAIELGRYSRSLRQVGRSQRRAAPNRAQPVSLERRNNPRCQKARTHGERPSTRDA